MDEDGVRFRGTGPKDGDHVDILDGGRGWDQDPPVKTGTGSSAFTAQQFHPSREPDKPLFSIFLGLFLLMCGTFSLGTLIRESITGETSLEMETDQSTEEDLSTPVFGVRVNREQERFWSLLFLGFVSFTPGAYIVFLALMAAMGRPGYSYSDIPSS